MTHRLEVAEARRAERVAKTRPPAGEPLPVGTAMAIIAGASAILWALIAIAIISVI
jgi:hypothetical protein